MKAFIIMLLLCGIGGITTVVLGNVVAKTLSRVAPVIKGKLDALPDEKVQNYAQQIHRIGKKIEPVIYELKLLWQTDQRPATELPDKSINSIEAP